MATARRRQFDRRWGEMVTARSPSRIEGWSDIESEAEDPSSVRWPNGLRLEDRLTFAGLQFRHQLDLAAVLEHGELELERLGYMAGAAIPASATTEAIDTPSSLKTKP
jgi:hypothetical protein